MPDITTLKQIPKRHYMNIPRTPAMVPKFLAILFVMIVIFILSHIPGKNLPSMVSGMDKLFHTIAYAALAGSCLFFLNPLMANKKNWWFEFWVIFFCFLYGLSDEFHQSFIIGRSSSWKDIGADIIGATVMVFGWHWWRTR